MVIVNQDFIDEEKQTKGLHCTPHDRDLIELGLKDRQNFTQIGLSIGKHPTTVSKEVRKNRTALYGHTWRRAPYCMNYDTCQHQDLSHMPAIYLVLISYPCSVPNSISRPTFVMAARIEVTVVCCRCIM